MSDKDIDFEELDRAISALMEGQESGELSVDSLLENNDSVDSGAELEASGDLETQTLAPVEEVGDLAALLPEEPKTKVDAVSGSVRNELKIQDRGSVLPSHSKTSDLANNLNRQRLVIKPLEESTNAKLAVENNSGAAPESLQTKLNQVLTKMQDLSTRAAAKPLNAQDDRLQSSSETKLPQAELKSAETLNESKSEKMATDSNNSSNQPNPISVTKLPSRRGRYMEFVSAGGAAAKLRAETGADVWAEKRRRAAQINRTSSQTLSDIKPISRASTLDFAMTLPAKHNKPALDVKGTYQTSHSTTKTEKGETLSVKRQTMNYIAKPVRPETDEASPEPHKVASALLVVEDKVKASEVGPELNRATEEKTEILSKDSDDGKLKSPFIAEAKVKKRPLGQPEPMLQSPNLNMKVPERISTYDCADRTALYRAELHPKSSEKRTSKFWPIFCLFLLLVVAGIVYFFWGDLKAIFL